MDQAENLEQEDAFGAIALMADPSAAVAAAARLLLSTRVSVRHDSWGDRGPRRYSTDACQSHDVDDT